MRKLLGILVIAMLSSISPAMAEWPTKPIKLIVPFKAGGTSDQVGRTLQAGVQDTGSLSKPITKHSNDKTETFRFNLGTSF